MGTEHIRIPERQTKFIHQLIAEGRFANVDDAIRASVFLLEEQMAQEARQKEKLRSMMDKAFAGGVVDETFDEIWDAAEMRFLKENA